MKKVEILTRIKKAGVIAVIRENTSEVALEAAKAVIKGGIYGIEVTYTVPEADQVIKKLKTDEHIVVGAGTVLDVVTARLAIMAGAEFIVSPSFNQETAELCNMYQIPYIPGCMTVTEIQRAMIAGADIVKLFPANHFKPEIIKAMKAPLPQVNIMPTGGISLDNLLDWKEAGAIAVGVGGNLFKGAKEENFSEVKMAAERYSQKWQSEFQN
ncbi:2-dehydro-3-deoxyphosphogluconate aldolase/4-hydroxy-2-oxoglutarate aldolase [Bacillus cereus BAG5X1-1]|uniref:2-dehydro-3-deoxyphosphogluconate aldolase/4-hydroxy-2-oxoglutarate aldolase n=1 Tax=Bacillus cereus BAG5X1-1 TaxID=1053189 RepID=J7ZMK4_BACCE|nr:bifunctional 2-keto-4-hydroxyglutarate aldolase/2-keto-3-deoxy-6-phosphogluconate aldolase [Bacillus cereus]EJQ37596.1 2-dehydro-3-deoxyphosphogluconate aldolase/4-hydroxy-2-oxoglutarate aldolase [Bacillus cereus BAG5X1-1]